MKPGDKVKLKKTENPTSGTIIRPAAQDVNTAWVVRVNENTEIVVTESDLDPA